MGHQHIRGPQDRENEFVVVKCMFQLRLIKIDGPNRYFRTKIGTKGII